MTSRPWNLRPDGPKTGTSILLRLLILILLVPFGSAACGAGSPLAWPSNPSARYVWTWSLESILDASATSLPEHERVELMRQHKTERIALLQLFVMSCNPREEFGRNMKELSYSYVPARVGGGRSYVAIVTINSQGEFLIIRARDKRDSQSPFAGFGNDLIVMMRLSEIAQEGIDAAMAIELRFERWKSPIDAEFSHQVSVRGPNSVRPQSKTPSASMLVGDHESVKLRVTSSLELTTRTPLSHSSLDASFYKQEIITIPECSRTT